MQWIADRFAANPIAWLLLVAFLVTLHGNYQNGSKLTEVCGLLEYDSPLFRRLPTVVFKPDRIAAICAERIDSGYGE